MTRTSLAVLGAAVVVIVTALLTAPSIIAALRQPATTSATSTVTPTQKLGPLSAEISCSRSDPGPGNDTCAITWDNADLILRLPDGTPQRFALVH